jgi:hypothetical protein
MSGETFPVRWSEVRSQCRQVESSFRYGLAESRHRDVKRTLPSMAPGFRHSVPERRRKLN